MKSLFDYAQTLDERFEMFAS